MSNQTPSLCVPSAIVINALEFGLNQPYPSCWCNGIQPPYTEVCWLVLIELGCRSRYSCLYNVAWIYAPRLTSGWGDLAMPQIQLVRGVGDYHQPWWEGGSTYLIGVGQVNQGCFLSSYLSLLLLLHLLSLFCYLHFLHLSLREGKFYRRFGYTQPTLPTE